MALKKLSQTKIFVTGATGFIGQHLLRRLIKKSLGQQHIYCFLRNANRLPTNLKGRVTILLGSDTQIIKYKKVIEQCQYIFHFAARSNLGNGDEYYRDNVAFTQKLVEIARQSNKLIRFVFLSSIAAVDRTPMDSCDHPLSEYAQPYPLSDYGKSKLLCEQIIKDSPLPYSIVRPTWVYGPLMRANSHLRVLIEAVRTRTPFTNFNFPGRVSLIYIDDLIEAILLVAHHPIAVRQVYFASTTDLSLGEIFQDIGNYLGVKAGWITPPVPRTLAQVFRPYLPIKIQNLFSSVLWASAKKLNRLGFRARTSWTRSLLLTLNWHSKSLDPLRNNRALVTGAAGGIGRALATQLYARGYDLLLVDKDQKQLANLVHLLNAEIHTYDLAKMNDLGQLANKIRNHRHPINVLINNAGIGVRALFEVGKIQLHQDTLIVNNLAPLWLTHAFLTRKVRKANQTIINLSSSAAFQPLPFMATYAASKASLLFWSLALAEESRKFPGREVITVCPSGTKTKFQKTAGVRQNKREKLLSPEFVASKVISHIGYGSRLVTLGTPSKIMHLIAKLLPLSIQPRFWMKFMRQYR